MSSKLNDITVLGFTVAATKPSSAVVTAVTAAGVDMATYANNQVFAIQVVGTVAGTEIVYLGKIQQATTLTGSYTDITGAVFSTVTSTTGVPAVQLLSFQRDYQFVRYVGTISGTTSSVALDVLIGGQKNQVT